MYMTRKEIFDQIWIHTVQGFAEENELNYQRLLKVLKAEEIPKPGRREIFIIRQEVDSWRALQRPPLPGDPEKEVELPRRRTAEFLPGEKNEIRQKRAERRKEKANTLDYESHPRWRTMYFLPAEERKKVIKETEAMRIRQNKTFHPKVLEIQREISTWQAQVDVLGNETIAETITRRPAVVERVSVESFHRVLRILDCLYTSVELLGGSVLENATVRVDNQNVVLRFMESRSRKESRSPEDGSSGVTQVYNGKLTLQIGYLYTVKDRKQDTIEDRLGDALELIYQTAFQMTRRKSKELEELRKKEESFNREMVQTEQLVQQARDLEDATRIRELILTVQKKLPEEEIRFQENFPVWASWASEKADWLDPTVGRSDPVLGRRHDPILKPQESES